MPALGGKHVPNLNPQCIGSHHQGQGQEVPGEAQVMPWGAKGKKGPPKPSRGMAFPSMPGSGH